MAATLHLDAWHDVFVMIGASAGSLVGLLFIVMSLHLDRIASRDDANTRLTIEGGRNNTYHLLTVLVEAVCVLAPQPALWLGVELIAINLYGLRLPLMITARYLRQRVTISERGGFPTTVIVTVIFAYLLGVVGGLGALAGRDWAIYAVAVSCVIKLVRTALTAWMLMFGMIRAEAAKKAG